VSGAEVDAFGEVGPKIVRGGRFEVGPRVPDRERFGRLTGSRHTGGGERRGGLFRRFEDRRPASDQQDRQDRPEGDPADWAQRGAQRSGLNLLSGLS
jgi:hypothetical protein